MNQKRARIAQRPGIWFVMMLTLGALTALPYGASADDSVRLGAHDVATVFYIAKSENNVQVHYGVRLDEACRPVGSSPVFAYWSRQRAAGRQAARLDGMARRLYGVSEKQNVQVKSTGGRVQMHVRALERVAVDIEIEKTPSGCAAVPTTKIGAERAQLESAFLKIGRFGMSVDYVDVIGSRLANGARVVQRIRS